MTTEDIPLWKNAALPIAVTGFPFICSGILTEDALPV
jgi:hypothetical protein